MTTSIINNVTVENLDATINPVAYKKISKIIKETNLTNKVKLVYSEEPMSDYGVYNPTQGAYVLPYFFYITALGKGCGNLSILFFKDTMCPYICPLDDTEYPDIKRRLWKNHGFARLRGVEVKAYLRDLSERDLWYASQCKSYNELRQPIINTIHPED